MGMDVYGLNPRSEAGEYFRQSVWGWHPLWDLVEAFAPELASKVPLAHTNDGDGLDNIDAQLLALILQDGLNTGAVRTWITERDEALAALPLEECRWCNGTGTRTDEVGVELGYMQRGWCNGCDGAGKVKQFPTMYRTDEEQVAEFTAFLYACGGFQIL